MELTVQQKTHSHFKKWKAFHKGDLRWSMQIKESSIFVEKVTQTNKCWFWNWERWFLLPCLIIWLLLHFDIVQGFINDGCNSLWCDDGIMIMSIEVFPNNHVYVNTDHLIQSMCSKDKNLMYGTYDHIFSKLTTSFRMWIEVG